MVSSSTYVWFNITDGYTNRVFYPPGIIAYASATWLI